MDDLSRNNAANKLTRYNRLGGRAEPGGPTPEDKTGPRLAPPRERRTREKVVHPAALLLARPQGKADHLAGRTARPLRPYPPSPARSVYAVRPKGGAPVLAWAGGGGPDGLRDAAEASLEPSGAADGTTATAAKTDSGLGQARPSPFFHAHMRLGGCRARAPKPSRRYLRRGRARARVTADLTSSLSRLNTFVPPPASLPFSGNQCPS